MLELGNALIGTVDSRDETEYNFKEEFDYLYWKLNSLRHAKITKGLQLVKSLMNQFIKENICTKPLASLFIVGSFYSTINLLDSPLRLIKYIPLLHALTSISSSPEVSLDRSNLPLAEYIWILCF